MSTDYPYSQQWRERTRERLRASGLTLAACIEQVGLDLVDASLQLIDPGRPVSLEIAGPIDELLAKLEEQREAKALRRPPRALRVPGRGDLVPVAVDLDALTNCDVVLHGRPR